jgi:hypothetical protein
MSKEYSVPEIINKIEEVLTVCKLNHELYKNKKEEMMVKIREYDPVFYNRHYRICKSIVQESDISDLLKMLENLYKVKSGQSTLKEKDKEVSNKYNSIHINPILNRPELIKEREDKIKEYKNSSI